MASRTYVIRCTLCRRVTSVAPEAPPHCDSCSSMRALTVCQPYAHLIAIGDKPIENRTWWTSYRGPLLIHAGLSREWLDDGDDVAYPDMVFGAVVAIADLVACLAMDEAARWPLIYRHLATHEHANGPWCWVLENVYRLRQPVRCTGARQLWRPEPHVIAQIHREKAA